MVKNNGGVPIHIKQLTKYVGKGSDRETGDKKTDGNKIEILHARAVNDKI